MTKPHFTHSVTFQRGYYSKAQTKYYGSEANARAFAKVFRARWRGHWIKVEIKAMVPTVAK